MPSSTLSSRSVQLPSAFVLVGGVYAVCVLAMDALFLGVILFGDGDPHRSEGPIDSLVTISVVGTLALAIGVGLALWFGRTPGRARVGSLVLVALAVLTIVFFWSGAPGILGACAAWCAGLTRGGRPVEGASRAAGIVGAFLALLNVLLTIGGVLLSPVAG
jgi:hypothetical protein